MIAKRIAQRLAQEYGWRQPNRDVSALVAYIKKLYPGRQALHEELRGVRTEAEIEAALEREQTARPALRNPRDLQLPYIKECYDRRGGYRRQSQYGWRKPATDAKPGWYIGPPEEGRGPFPSQALAVRAIRAASRVYDDFSTDDIQQVPGPFRPYAGWGIWILKPGQDGVANLFIDNEEGTGPWNYGYDRHYTQEIADEMNADDDEGMSLEVRRLQ